MHRALCIHEVLVTIIENCTWVYEPDDELRHPWIGTVASTCRAFYEPAMNATWNTLSDISPLFRCLPSDLWFIESEFGDGIFGPISRFHLRRPLTSQEWTIVTKHAHRVKVITHSLDTRAISQTVTEQVVTHFRTGQHCTSIAPLLPNLISFGFCYNSIEESLLSCLSLLFGASLRVLSLSEAGGQAPHTATSVTALVDFLTRCSTSSPYLQVLKVGAFTHDGWEPLTFVPVHIISLWTHLRHISIPSLLTPDVLIKASSLPSLRTLVMPVRSSFNPPQGHSPILFPTLEILHLDPENFGDVLPFIRWVRLPQLRDFRVFNKTAFSNGSHLEELLSHLSAFKLLSDVTILAIPNIFGPSPLNTLTATSFAPLLDLHSLSVLDVNPNMAIDLDDDVLAAMATAWPRIKVLSIVPSLELPTKPRATLGALIPLVTQCPLLCSVALPLDLLIPEKYIRCDMRTYRSNRKWAAFDIWYWSDVVADNWIMADFLCELLPTVHNAFSVRRVGFAKPYFKSWLLFQRYVKLFGGYQEKPRPSSVLSEP